MEVGALVKARFAKGRKELDVSLLQTVAPSRPADAHVWWSKTAQKDGIPFPEFLDPDTLAEITEELQSDAAAPQWVPGAPPPQRAAPTPMSTAQASYGRLPLAEAKRDAGCPFETFIQTMREDPGWVPMPTLGEKLSEIGAREQYYVPK